MAFHEGLQEVFEGFMAFHEEVANTTNIRLQTCIIIDVQYKLLKFGLLKFNNTPTPGEDDTFCAVPNIARVG